MALQVIWTENALEDYKKVIDYLLKEWPINVAERFIDNVENRLETLSVFPNIGIRSLKEINVRAIVLTEHNKLYYRVTERCIEVLGIFDTRQDPLKNKYD